MFIIAVAGLPGSGKTTLARYIADRLDLPMICKDSVKEILFDTVGFRSKEEKTHLNEASLQIMFYLADELLAHGDSVLLENNFENNAYPLFEKLRSRYDVRIVTIYVGGDLHVIHARYEKRNLDPTRHRGHVVDTAYPEKDTPALPPEPMSFEAFYERFYPRGMMDFHVGTDTIEVDNTDFSKVDREALVQRIRDLLG